MKSLLIAFVLFLSSNLLFSQVPNDFVVSSGFSAERNARFRVADAPDDFLEITNSTQFDDSFIPSIWAHHQSDNRFVLRLFATTTSAYDDGDIPIMIFRTELRNAINQVAPSGGTFPWGTNAAPIFNRPVFAWENGSTQLMTLRANGFLGLGTTTPTALFHTVGSVRFEDLLVKTTPNFMLGTDANGNVYKYPYQTGGTGTADADWLKPDGSVALSIDDDIYTNGKVGINVQFPAATLHVNGTVRLENLSSGIAAPDFILGTDIDGNVSKYIPQAGGGSIADADWLQPDGTVSYSINNNIYTNGKVSIGTSNIPTTVGSEDVSSYSLFVKGGVLTEEVRVAVVSDWADYVFKKDYQLPTLKEVEQQIVNAGHLKDIPSEKEVKENGVDLLEMNKLLLKKVEELTLYLIEIDKKMAKQEQELKEIKAKSKK